MKRIISTILTVSMLFTMAPAFASDVDTADVNYNLQLFSVGDGEAVVKQSAKQPDVITADFEEQGVGQITGTSVSGTNFKFTAKPEGGTEAYYIEQDDNGNKYITLTNEAGGYTTSAGSLTSVTSTLPSDVDKLGVSYRIRFNKPVQDWHAINIVGSGGHISASYADGGRIGVNYGGNYSTNTAAQTKYGGATPGLVKAEIGIWYTISYVIDYDTYTYDMSIVPDTGDVEITTTTKDGTDPLKGIPFRVSNVKKGGSITFIMPHDSKDTSTTAEGSFSIDDISVYNVTNELTFNLIGPETLSDDVDMRLEYNNTTGEDKDVCVTYVAYEDGIVVDTDEVVETLTTDNNVVNIPVSVDTSACAGEVTYDAFVTDAATGATLCTAGSKESGSAPEDFVTATEANGKISVKVAKDSAYDAAVIRVYDEDENLVGIKEQKISNAAISFDVNDYNKEYKVDVTLADAAGNAAYGKAYVTVWDPAIAEDFNNDPEVAFETHMDALNKAYGGDFEAVYNENSDYINSYIMLRDDYTSVYDIIDAVLSLDGFFALMAAEDEAAFAGVIEDNADSFGIVTDDVYWDNKDAIIAKLFADKDDFIIPDDFVAAYNDTYIACEFNSAPVILLGKLFEKYKDVLGITVDSVYYSAEATANELVCNYRDEKCDGAFASADDIAKAYRSAYAAVEEMADDEKSPYDTIAVSDNYPVENVIDFEELTAVENQTENYTGDGYSINVNGGMYNVVEEDGNKYINLTAPEQTKRAVEFKVAGKDYGEKVKISTKFKANKISAWILFYVGSNASCLNLRDGMFKENWGAVAAPDLGSKPVSADTWYTITWDIDGESDSYDLYIVNSNDPSDVIVDKTGIAFRSKDATGTGLSSLTFSTSSEHSTESDIVFDDIKIGSASGDGIAFSAKGSKNCTSGTNGVAVNIRNFTDADKDINVYIPVYVDGKLYTVANEQVYAASGESTDVVATFELDEMQAATATYDVVVADSLDGFNYGITSATENGTLTLDASADFEAEVINVKTGGTFDNGTIIVLAPGATIATAAMTDILYYDNVNEAEVTVADGISGDLNVYAVAQDKNGKVTVEKATVYYPGNGIADKLVKAFNDATAETVSSVVAEYITVINSIEEGMNSFYVANAAAVDAALVANKPYESMEQVINTIKSVKALSALKAAASEAEFETAFAEFADMFDVEFDSIYTDNKADFTAKMYAAKDTFNTYEDVMAAYDAIYMIYDFNAATEDTIGDKLAEYAAALGIELDELYTSKSVYIDRLVAADIPFADAAEIVSSYNNAYAKAEALEGDFTVGTVAQSATQMSIYEYTFDELDVVAGATADLTMDGYNIDVVDSTTAYYDIVDNNGDRYIKLYQEAGGEDAAKVNINKLASGDMTSLSYRFMFEKLDAGYVLMKFGNASYLYIQNGKFGVNFGQDKGGMVSSGTKEDVATNVWYTVKYDVDVKNKVYDVVITKDDGTVVFEHNDAIFRGDGVGSLDCVTPHRDGETNGVGNVTVADTVMCIDDVKSTGYSAGSLYYSVNALNSLLPGDNAFDISISNMTASAVGAIIYVPVYADGALVSMNKIYDGTIDSNGTLKESKMVNVPAALFNSGASIDYDVFVVESIDGVNYGVASKAVFPRQTTPSTPVVDYATETIKVSGTTTYDNMSILVTGPVADGRDYDIEAAKTDASVIAYYAPAELTAISTERDAATDEKITTSSFAADIKVPEQFVNGDYNIYLVSQNQAGDVQTSYAYTYYAGSDMLDDMLADFNAITESNVEATVNKYMEVLEGVADDAATFYAENKAAVNAALLAEDSFANVGEINSVIFSIYAIDKMAAAADVAAFKSIFEYYANVFGIDTATAEYAEGAAEITQRLYDDRANLTTDNINSKYATALMLSEINNAERGEVETVLAKYETELGIDVDSAAYQTYKDYIAKAIAADGVVFDSVAEVKTAYSEGIAAGQNSGGNSSPQPAGPTGTTGGGGGGGGGSITANVPQPYVEPETSLGQTASSAFTDLDTVPWAVEAITELKRIGVISGVSETQFAPDRAVTREEFAKMIVNAFSISGEGKTFTDVPATAWYAPYVTALASSGIVNGVSESAFGVGTKITRQDAAVMLDRVSAHIGIEYEFDTSALNIFSDYMADYARISIYRLYQNGVINGTSATTFCATDTLTRAQAAKMIYGLMQLK